MSYFTLFHLLCDFICIHSFILMPSVRIYNKIVMKIMKKTLNKKACPKFWLAAYVYLFVCVMCLCISLFSLGRVSVLEKRRRKQNSSKFSKVSEAADSRWMMIHREKKPPSAHPLWSPLRSPPCDRKKWWIFSPAGNSWKVTNCWWLIQNILLLHGCGDGNYAHVNTGGEIVKHCCGLFQLSGMKVRIFFI